MNVWAYPGLTGIGIDVSITGRGVAFSTCSTEAGFSFDKGQGALLSCQDVLLSTIEQVAIFRPFGLFRQMDSPRP